MITKTLDENTISLMPEDSDDLLTIRRILKTDDKIVGDNMHTIRTNGIYKEDNPYRSMIPQRIVDKYGHIRF